MDKVSGMVPKTYSALVNLTTFYLYINSHSGAIPSQLGR
jgi:hypothetical protein